MVSVLPRVVQVVMLCGLSALALLGCAALDPMNSAVPTAAGPPPLLSPWLTLTGGWRAEPIATPGGRGAESRNITPARLLFQRPVGVAARNDRVLIADAGRRQVYLFDRARDAVVALLPLSGIGAEQPIGMQLMTDGSAWIADSGRGQIVQVDRTGAVVRTLRDPAFVSRPVAVAAPEPSGDVYVADATSASIVVFSAAGRVLRRLGGGGRVLQSVGGISLGPDGLYVVDRLAQQVVVFGLDGRFLYALGEALLTMPRTIAVDRWNRVFVGDDADQSIKVFLAGEHIASYGGPASPRARLGRIDALALDGNLLYVADGLEGKVQILLVAPESLRR